MGERERIRRLEAALRICRGWVLASTDKAQARRDLTEIDRALKSEEDAGEQWICLLTKKPCDRSDLCVADNRCIDGDEYA